jgi:hypothetical protein
MEINGQKIKKKKKKKRQHITAFSHEKTPSLKMSTSLAVEARYLSAHIPFNKRVRFHVLQDTKVVTGSRSLRPSQNSSVKHGTSILTLHGSQNLN